MLALRTDQSNYVQPRASEGAAGLGAGGQGNGNGAAARRVTTDGRYSVEYEEATVRKEQPGTLISPLTPLFGDSSTTIFLFAHFLALFSQRCQICSAQVQVVNIPGTYSPLDGDEKWNVLFLQFR